MRKICVILVSIFLTAILTSCQSAPATPSDNRLQVVTTIYPVYDFAIKVGGEAVNVTRLVPAGAEPHDWEPNPSDMIKIQEADVFIYNGAGMEQWVDSVLNSVSSGNLIVVNTADTLALRPAGTSHEEHGEGTKDAHNDSQEGSVGEHDSGAYDPHIWLDPMNAKEQMRVIKEAFVQSDPVNKSVFETNFETYAAAFDQLDKEYSDAIHPLTGRNIVVAHEAFGYLCDRYGLTQIPIEGIAADSEPDAARMAEIIDFVNKNKVRVIFSEELLSPKVAETIASETGAATDILNPVGGLTEQQIKEGEDYFSIMRRNLKALVRALSGEV